MLPLFRDKVGEARIADQQKQIIADQQKRRTALGGSLSQLRSNRSLAQRQVLALHKRGGLSAPAAAPATSMEHDVVQARRLAVIADHLVSEAERGLVQIDLETRLVQQPAIEWFQGFVNPVQQPYSTSDTFGAPRVGHKHEGIDIFAERGTPIRATVNGVLRDVKKTPIGGRIVYITSADGTYYYYAHLDRWAPGISDGQQVVAGQILGFVGRTGNAEATPPHLHFEIHPLGGPPLNPWLIIRAVQKKDAAAFGQHTVTVSELCQLAADDARRQAAFTATSIANPDEKPTSSAPSTTIAPGICPARKGRE